MGVLKPELVTKGHVCSRGGKRSEEKEKCFLFFPPFSLFLFLPPKSLSKAGKKQICNHPQPPFSLKIPPPVLFSPPYIAQLGNPPPPPNTFEGNWEVCHQLWGRKMLQTAIACAGFREGAVGRAAGQGALGAPLASPPRYRLSGRGEQGEHPLGVGKEFVASSQPCLVHAILPSPSILLAEGTIWGCFGDFEHPKWQKFIPIRLSWGCR